MRSQIVAALEESLAALPDPADILVEVHDGIERRHRRNRYYRTGFAITAIALILILSMAAASVSPQPHDRTPAGIPVGDWKTSIRPTWLPADMVAQEFISTAAGESIKYHSPESDLSIHIGDIDDSALFVQSETKQTVLDRLLVTEWSLPTQTGLGFQLPSGRWVKIGLNRNRAGVTDAQPAVRNEAMQVARSLRADGNLLLRTTFAPSYLPVGQRIIGVETNIFTTPGFGTIVCASGSLQPKVTDKYQYVDLGLGLRISMTNVAINKDLDQTVRIADIQGRPAYTSISGATVYVADFHGGTLSVDATIGDGRIFPSETDVPPGLPPLAELIKVAEGVRWNG